ncbi:MAG: DUF6527 family protein [Chloroflexi bacterium]|nr:DUF6527 family protein [Chloroflexota bacterium]
MIKCRMVDFEKIRTGEYRPVPGDMWYAPGEIIKNGKDGGSYIYGYRLSDQYVANVKDKRQPIFVCLPRNIHFCVDSATSDGNGKGWEVSGEAPNINVSPSVHIVNRWHGWLKNGEITDA